MNIVNFSLKRPVTTLMIYLTILMLGIVSLTKIPIKLLPEINYPLLTISTTYLSASPSEIENMITVPIEESISTVEGIRDINSISKEGLSTIYANFIWGTNIDKAILDVRQKIDQIKEKLPKETENPLIKKINPFSMPLMTISFTADADMEQVMFYLNKFIKDKLNKIEGIALIKTAGNTEKEIFIDLDAARLKAYNLNTQDIITSLNNNNLNYPAGTTKSEYYEYLIKTSGKFKDLDDIEENIIITDSKDNKDSDFYNTIAIKNIGTVYEAYPETKTIARLDQKPVITLSIYKQSDANTIETAAKITHTLKNLEILKQKNITYKIIYNQAEFIKSATQNTKNAAILGSILAFLALLFFLRSFLAAGVAFIAIPLSIFACFIFMLFSDISLNLMSLSGIALCIGMLVDNAIVVIENIKRHMDTAENKANLIEKATMEVTFALLSSTLTTVSVFLPLLFLEDLAGELFSGLAAVVTFALIISFIVSITLIPRLHLNVRAIKADNYLKKAKYFTDILTKKYRKLLTQTLKDPSKLFKIILILFLLSGVCFYLMPKEIIPEMTEDNFIIKIDMPISSTIEYTDLQVKKIETILAKEKNIHSFSIIIGSDEKENTGLITLAQNQAQLTIKTNKLSDKYLNALQKKIKPVLLKNTKIKYTKISAMQNVVSQNCDLHIQLKSFKTHKELITTAKSLTDNIEKYNFIKSLESDLPELTYETCIDINKKQAALKGIDSDYISASLYAALNGKKATELTKDELNIPVTVRLKERDRNDLDKIKHLPLMISKDEKILLKNVASIYKAHTPNYISRKNGTKSIEIKLNFTDNISYDKAVKLINHEIKKTKNSEDIEIKISEKSTQHKKAFSQLSLMFLLAVFLIYMIMAAQFENLFTPFIIILTVPFSIIGVGLGLLIFGKSLNVISILAIIMLCGIGVNNGIILIEYIEDRIKGTADIKEAITDACVLRFRPILITCITTLFGLLPMIFTTSYGAAIRSTLAVTLSFGLIMSTVLILFVLPVIYLKYASRRNKAI